MSDTTAMIYGAGCTIVGAILGAGVSWYFSRMYYQQSGKDFAKGMALIVTDHNTQFRSFTALARMLEHAKLAKGSYDATGNLTGVTISADAHASATATATAVGRVIRAEPPRDDRQHEQPDGDTSDGIDA
jgi:hypothetical protein